MKPELDGIDHINVYSKGKTELGRFLSNFAHTMIITEDGRFDSIEGYWYWLGCKNESLRRLHGWSAKDLGRKVGAPDWQDSVEFKRKILAAIDIKLKSYPRMLNELQKCKLPLVHYYVYGKKIINVPDADWILAHLDSYKMELYDL